MMFKKMYFVSVHVPIQWQDFCSAFDPSAGSYLSVLGEVGSLAQRHHNMWARWGVEPVTFGAHVGRPTTAPPQPPNVFSLILLNHHHFFSLSQCFFVLVVFSCSTFQWFSTLTSAFLPLTSLSSSTCSFLSSAHPSLLTSCIAFVHYVLQTSGC